MDNNNRIDYDPIKSEADKVSVKQAVGSFVNFLKIYFLFMTELISKKLLRILEAI